MPTPSVEHSPLIGLRFRGSLALFTQPHFRASPHTYPVATPSAAKGMWRSIYGKPQVEWEIADIHLLSPIRYDTRQVSAMKRSGATPMAVEGPDSARTLQTSTFLVDVDYLIRARFAVSPYWTNRGTPRTVGSYMAEIMRNFERGRQFRQPTFGRAELLADWELCELEDVAHMVRTEINMDVGSLLFDLSPIDMARDQWNPIFFRAAIEEGVLTVPQDLYDKHRDRLMRERYRVNDKKGSRHAA